MADEYHRVHKRLKRALPSGPLPSPSNGVAIWFSSLCALVALMYDDAQQADFRRFGLLPVELRLRIWELARVPPRLIVLSQCQCTRTHTKLDASDVCREQGHLRAKGAFRWRIYPRQAAIPATLHCCHESRKALLRRYHRPPCATGTTYWHAPATSARHGQGVSFPVAFQCPFVDYENDIFVIRQMDVFHADRSSYFADETTLQQPLIGFDMSMVEHIGWFDSLYGYSDHPAKVTPLQALSSLRDLTVLDFIDARKESMLERLSKGSFSLQPWQGMTTAFQCSLARKSVLYRESIAISSKRIQVVLWHAKSGIKIILWHHLQQRLSDPGLESMKELDCTCTLGSRHTVSLEGEVLPLRWMRIVPDGDDLARAACDGRVH
jgi:hypothetical protein